MFLIVRLMAPIRRTGITEGVFITASTREVMRSLNNEETNIDSYERALSVSACRCYTIWSWTNEGTF